MSLSIACSSCGARLHAPDDSKGRSFNCPKCGKKVTVEAITGQLPVASIHTPPHAPAVVDVAPADVVHEEPTKACPFCGETVLAVAKKCKHCGEIIDVTLRAAEEARRAAKHRDTPAVYMNAGGGGASSSSAASSSSSAAVSGLQRVILTPFVGCGCFSAMVLGVFIVCTGMVNSCNNTLEHGPHAAPVSPRPEANHEEQKHLDDKVGAKVEVENPPGEKTTQKDSAPKDAFEKLKEAIERKNHPSKQ